MLPFCNSAVFQWAGKKLLQSGRPAAVVLCEAPMICVAMVLFDGAQLVFRGVAASAWASIVPGMMLGRLICASINCTWASTIQTIYDGLTCDADGNLLGNPTSTGGMQDFSRVRTDP